MALPRRIPKERNRSDRWRSPAHCNFVRQHECSVPGCAGRPIEVAHLRNGTDAAMGRKASDWFTISLCRDCHAEQHRLGEQSFATKHKLNLHLLALEFAVASPKARDISQAKMARHG